MAPAEPEVYNIELQSEEEHIPEIMMDEVKWNRLEGRQARHLCPICPTDNSTVSTAKQNTALHGCCPAIYRTVTKSFTRSRTTTVRVWTTTTYCPPAPPPPEVGLRFSLWTTRSRIGTSKLISFRNVLDCIASSPPLPLAVSKTSRSKRRLPLSPRPSL